jgi:hypothetical protein
MPVIRALGRPRQEDSKFKANLGYIGHCLKNKSKKKIKTNTQKRKGWRVGGRKRKVGLRASPALTQQKCVVSYIILINRVELLEKSGKESPKDRRVPYIPAPGWAEGIH